jgi:hypothetical protein
MHVEQGQSIAQVKMIRNQMNLVKKTKEEQIQGK